MLKAQIIGNVGRDPDIEHKQDYSFARFSLATNKKVKGEKQTTWVNVTVFGDKRVEFIGAYVRKGAKLFVEGDVQAHYYKTRDGDDAASLDVLVGSFDGKLELLSSEPVDNDRREERPPPRREAPPSRQTAPPARQRQPETASQQYDDELDDDIPF
jgi:single-strand DNA-binding protein